MDLVHGESTVFAKERKNTCEVKQFISFALSNFHFEIPLLNTLPTAEILSGKNARAWVSMDFT